MATLQNRIELSDGVTPTLDRIVNGAAHVTGRFEQVGRAAETMSGSAEAVTARFVPGMNAVGSAAQAAAGSVGAVSAAASQADTGMNILAMMQSFGVVNAVLVQICEQLIKFQQGIEGAIKDVKLLAQACNAVHAPPAAEMREVSNAATVAVQNINQIEQAVSSVSLEFQAAADSIGDMNHGLDKAAGAIRDVSAGAESLPPLIGVAVGNATSMNHRLEETTGILGSIKNALSSTFAQFTLASMAADGIMRLIEVITQAPGKLAVMSDQYSGVMARMEMVAGSQEKATTLNDQIYYSALRARGGYIEMADAVSKIAMTAKEAFPDPKAVVPFMENVQKLFTIGGTDAVRQKDALLQLTQALGSGKLQGDEFRSIAEAAPMIEQMVAQYMGVSQGALKELSSQGEITAEVMKNAILGATDEINAKMESIPLKWQDISQRIQTEGYRAFVPVFEQISRLANSPAMKTFADGIVTGTQVASLAILGLMNNVEWLTNTISNLYSQYQPAFDGLGATLFYVASVWAIYEAGVIAAAIATGVWAAATAAAGTVNILVMMITDLIALFTALGVAETYAALSGTAMWFAILMPVALVIGVIYLVVAAINYFTGTSISATGLIVGAFYWLGGMIYNVVAFVWNYFVAYAEYLQNFAKDPLAATYNLFAEIWNGIVEIVGRNINEIIGLINKLPGMEIGFVDWGKGIADRMEIEGGVDLSSWKAPYSSGNTVVGYDKWGSIMNEDWLPKSPPPPKEAPPAPESPTMPPLQDIAGTGKDTADNTKGMKDAMEITDEDIKYMRDIAEQEVINKYTTAEVKIEMTNNNNVSNDVDVDGMVRYTNDSLIDAMVAGAEAVHK